MTIEKAIEILTILERSLAPTMARDGTDAIKLSIAALKRVRTMSGYASPGSGPMLPGETKED